MEANVVSWSDGGWLEKATNGCGAPQLLYKLVIVVYTPHEYSSYEYHKPCLVMSYGSYNPT